MTRLLLIRHGATDVMTTHLAGRTSGIPLNEAGRAQAQALAKRLVKPDALITSPIQRARETAQIVGDRHGIAPQVRDSFVEFEFGEWTGRTFEELRSDARWQEFNRLRDSVVAPGGESMLDVQRRALAGLEEFRGEAYSGKTIAIVSHGDVIRSLLLQAAGSSVANYWRFTVGAASISELGMEGGADRIIRVNDCAHLESSWERSLGRPVQDSM